MAKAGSLDSKSTFRSKAFDTHETRNAGIGSDHRYNSRAQHVSHSRPQADTGSGMHSTAHSRSATTNDRVQVPSPRFPGMHRNYGARAEAMAIGIALGSPSDNPLPPLPVEAVPNGRNITSSDSGSSIVSSVASNTREACVEPAKSRARRWHTLGGIFGKKTSSPPSPDLPVLQMQCSSVRNPQQDRKPRQRQAEPHLRSHSPQRTRSAGDTGGGRAGGPHMRHLPKKEVKGLRMPDFARAKSAPLLRVAPVSPIPPPKDVDYTNTGLRALRQRIDTPPRLHVEIPNVEMERYSVMFGGLLHETQPLSLLARRHGQLGRLTSVGEGQEMVDNYDLDGELSRSARRATSPTVKSHSVSLFPSTSPCATRCTAKAKLYRPSPLQRAATAPGALSPNRATFDLSQTEQQGEITPNLHSPETASARSRGPNWSWGTSQLSRVSSESSLDERDVAPEESTKQVPPMRIPRSKFSDKALPTYPPLVDDEGESSNAPRPHKAAPLPRETSEKGRNAAEVLIARQISISAQQQRLLRSLVTRTARQPMHPVLVDVRNGLLVRNSHHVLLEEV